MISYKLTPDLYFNVNENSGRWNFSDKYEEISENCSLEKLNEFDNIIKTLIINITDKCNLNCVYCSRQLARKNPGSMSLDLIKDILKKASDYAQKNKIQLMVQFHGGEPLLEFNKIIEAIDNLTINEKANLKFRIQTNGTLLDKRIMEECKKRKIEIGVSLDGRKVENDYTRKDGLNKSTFEKVENALNLIKEYQKEINCLTVITNVNINNLENILKFFNKLGITNIGFLPLYEEPTTRTIKTSMIPNTKELANSQKKLFDRWITLLKNKKYEKLNITTFQILIWNLLSSNSPVKKFRVNCGVGINALFIEHDGNIWGCGAFSYAKKLGIGNITKQNFFDIQKGDAYNKFRERITSNVTKCKDCAFQFICKGGCVANGFKNNEDIFNLDIWCEYWEEIIKHILIRISENPELIKLIPNYNIKTK
ncbi:MAG: radical SAM protein [Candidatus Pacearchaeota archaeon]